MPLHKKLEAQIKDNIPEDLAKNPDFRKFLAAINNSYHEFEQHQEVLNPPFNNKNHDSIKLNEFIEISFNSLIANLQKAIVLFNENGKVLFVNNSFCRIFFPKLKRNILLGKPIEEIENDILVLINDDEKRQRFSNGIITSLDSKVNLVFDLKDLRKIECNLIPITKNLHTIGRLWMFIDVTESIKSREILSESKKLTEEILDNIPADIALFDPYHKYLYVNPQGIRNDEVRKFIIGKDDFDYYKYKGMDDSKAKQRRALFMQAIEKNTTIEWLDEHKRPDGTTIFMLRRFYPYFENKKLKYVFGYALDITELKRYEEELLRKNAELEKLNSELDAFVYSTSHNLRSPLTSIKGLVDLIAMDKISGEELDNYIEKINTSIERLDSTIYDIIEYSKNSRLALEPVLIDIENQIKNAFKDNEFFYDGNIKLLIHRNIVAPLYTDEKRITSIIGNIIENAIKYSDADKPNPYIKVTITVNQDNCTIIFEDNGIGIPIDKQEKVFEMFYRNSNKTFGSGLGLFIVKEMINKLKGTINLQSEEGIGTIITIKIPNEIGSLGIL